jgi:hypothetical protein
MGMRRNFITGEWEEFEDGSLGGTWVHHNGEVVRAEEVPRKLRTKSSRSAICAKRPWVSKSLGVANPDQIPAYAAAAKKHAGPGVTFDKQGNLVCDSRGARNRALAWLGKVDYDGGYGDRTESKRAA